MAKASRTRETRAATRKARSEARKQPLLSRRRRFLAGLKAGWFGISMVWKVFGVMLVLLGGVSQVYFFMWRLSLTPGDTLKDSDPFAVTFVLHNEGQFPVYDVRFICTVNSAKGNRVTLEEMSMERRQLSVPELKANSRTSFPCQIPVAFSPAPIIESVDLTLSVSYIPKFYLYRIDDRFDYIGSRKDDGSYAWIPIVR